MPLRERPPALLNRGAQAWANVERNPGGASIWLTDSHPEVLRVVTRSHVHAVNDDTNKVYLTSVAKALQAIHSGVAARRWPPPSSISELDSILAALVDDLIYVERMNQSVGSRLHAAWVHVFPDQAGQLPAFSRGIAGWRRFQQGGEGFGMCEERFGAIARVLFEDAVTLPDREAATWWSTQMDCYCREQDIELLRATTSDVAIGFRPRGEIQVTLFFGIRARGESVKTGSAMANQGVTIDRQWVARLVKELFDSRRQGAHLFSITRCQVMARVARACDKLGIPCDFGLHRLRHTGAANDIYYRRRDQQGVQARGRWVIPKSCERYTKVAHIAADFAALDPRTAKFGRDFLDFPDPFVVSRIPTPAVTFVA